MRYEQATGSPFLLPEKSATIKNVDSRTALIVRAITKNVKEVTLYPGQKFTYINAECYIQSVKQGLKVRVGIYPVAIEGESEGGEAVVGAGKSAYEIAIDYGFVGTEQEWIASLKGKDGEKGEKGDKGDTGEKGDQGIQGLQGDKGDPGKDGVDGITPTFTIGTVTNDSIAGASITGTSAKPVLNLTLVKGDKGEKGDDGQDGKSFTIHSQYSTYDDLIAEHATGESGDAYFVGTDSNPDLYIWLTDTNSWYNAGKIAGVKGDKGDPGDSIFGIDADGVYMEVAEEEAK